MDNLSSITLYKEYRERIKESHKHNNKKLLEMYIGKVLKQIKHDKWTHRSNESNMHSLVQLEEHLREIKLTNKKNQERENKENDIVVDLFGETSVESREREQVINDKETNGQGAEYTSGQIDKETRGKGVSIEDVINRASDYESDTLVDNEYVDKDIRGKGARGVIGPDTFEGGGQGQRDVIQISNTFQEEDPLPKFQPVTFSLPEKKLQIDPGEDHYKNFLTTTQKTDIRDLIKELKEFRRGL